MDAQLVERLFNETIQHPKNQRHRALTNTGYPREVRLAVTRLVKAHETPSAFLNDDLISDLGRLDPDWFHHDAADEQADDICF